MSPERIDLIWLSSSEAEAPPWSLGTVAVSVPTPVALARQVDHRRAPREAAAVLLWDAALGVPDEDTIRRALSAPGNVWHAGLRLGMGGLPRAIDYVAPTWMLNRDPDPALETTSWRLSLRACLIRSQVLEQLGGPRREFASLAGASLELGHRFIRCGALVRHLPWLVPPDIDSSAPVLPFDDELRFLIYRFGRRWSSWALLRAALTRDVSPARLFGAWQRLKAVARQAEPAPFVHSTGGVGPVADSAPPQVSVLIPTLDRYPYLRTLLAQLRTQTVRPFEIIVVDQTMPERRDLALAADFADLPLRLIYRDEAGQCSSRNAGLLAARGEYLLFIDDDDEIGPDLIARHLDNLQQQRADISSGVAYEVGAGPLPAAFTYTRASDVFPTNNSLVCFAALRRSGLFDLAYERGQRADGDLGMRLYLSGALMVLNAEIAVLHHHAPAGGLRAHKARVITYASSRRSLWRRHLPSATEIYLARRYFSPRQQHEMLWLRAFGTLSGRGSKWQRSAKLAIGALLLPDTWRRIRIRQGAAAAMLRSYPQIRELHHEP